MLNHRRYAKPNHEIPRSYSSLSLGNAASLKTLFDALGNACRNSSLELRNVSPFDSLSESGRHDIRAHGEQLIRYLARAKVLIVERSHECSRRAVGVELSVHRALVEGSHLESVDGVSDNPSSICGQVAVKDTVFWEHLCDQAAGSDDLELGSAGVNMRCIEATRA